MGKGLFAVFLSVFLLSGCGGGGENFEAKAQEIIGQLGRILYTGDALLATDSRPRGISGFRLSTRPPGLIHYNGKFVCDAGQASVSSHQRQRNFLLLSAQPSMSIDKVSFSNCQVSGAVDGQMALIAQDGLLQAGSTTAGAREPVFGFVDYGTADSPYRYSKTQYLNGGTTELASDYAIAGLAEWYEQENDIYFASTISGAVEVSGDLSFFERWTQGASGDPLIIEEFPDVGEASVSGPYTYESSSCALSERHISTQSRLAFDNDRMLVGGTLRVTNAVSPEAVEITFDSNGGAEFVFDSGQSIYLTPAAIVEAVAHIEC